MTKELSEFGKHSTYKDGIDSKCKACVNEYHRALWAKEPERHRTYNAKYKTEHKDIVVERNRLYRGSNPDKLNETRLKYRLSEKGAERARSYARSEQGKRSRRNAVQRHESTPMGIAKKRASTVKRRTSQMQRTPQWLDEDQNWMIQQAYELSELRSRMFGFRWHVDHVIPLQGKTVSGLHVPWNLRVIPWLDNQRKHNKVV